MQFQTIEYKRKTGNMSNIKVYGTSLHSMLSLKMTENLEYMTQVYPIQSDSL